MSDLIRRVDAVRIANEAAEQMQVAAKMLNWKQPVGVESKIIIRNLKALPAAKYDTITDIDLSFAVPVKEAD
jgi:hypothetical protein